MNGSYLKRGQGFKATAAHPQPNFLQLPTSPGMQFRDLIWLDLGAWEWKRFVTQLPGLIFLGNQKPYLLATDQKQVWLLQWILFVS